MIRSYVIFRSARPAHPERRSNLKKSAYYIALSGKTISHLIFGGARCPPPFYLPAFRGRTTPRTHVYTCVSVCVCVSALTNGIVRFHCAFDWIARDRTRRTSREEVINRRVYRGETHLRELAPADSTYDPIPKDNATRHVHSSRDPASVDFLRLHFRLSHGQKRTGHSGDPFQRGRLIYTRRTTLSHIFVCKRSNIFHVGYFETQWFRLT